MAEFRRRIKEEGLSVPWSDNLVNAHRFCQVVVKQGSILHLTLVQPALIGAFGLSGARFQDRGSAQDVA